MRNAVFVIVATLLVVASAFATDWPQWRGVDVDGISQDESFQAEFLVNGSPKVVWSKQVGTGYAPVTIAAGKAYTAGWNNGQDTVYCFDADTGEELWSYSYDSEKFDRQHKGGPSDAVAVDDARAYHFTRDGRLFCLDIDSGDLVWQRNIAEEYRIKAPRWAFAGSVIVADETLYLDAGVILALNPADGKEKWKTANFGAAYSTPTPFELQGKKLLAAFPERGLVVLERESGRVVAQHAWQTEYGVNAATPIVTGDKLFISSGYNTGCALLQLSNAGLKVVWENRNMRNQLPTSVFIDGHFYGFDDSVLTCISLEDGKQLWNARRDDLGKGALMAVGDTLVVMSETGELITAKASPAGFTPIARAKVLDEGGVWVMPTVANGKVYARGPSGAVVCIDTTAN